MLEVCYVVVLAVHLLAVNVGSAAPLACVWLDWCARRSQGAAVGDAARRLAASSLVAMSLGLLLGVALLGLLRLMNERPYLDTLVRISADRYWVALGELAFYYICMLWYLWLWERKRGTIWCSALALLAATDLLYHFPPLMATLSTIASRPELEDKVIDLAVFRTLASDPQVISRVVHTWLASLVLTGVAMAGCLVLSNVSEDNAAPCARVAVWGARLALLATLMQLVVGVWVLLELPSAAQSGLLGEDMIATSLLIGGLAATFALIHSLMAMSLGDAATRNVVRSIVLTAVVVLLMAGTVRRAASTRALPDAVSEIAARAAF